MGRRLRRAAERDVGVRHLRCRAQEAIREPRSLRKEAILLLPGEGDLCLGQRAECAEEASGLPTRALANLAQEVLRLLLHPRAAEHLRARLEAPRRLLA